MSTALELVPVADVGPLAAHPAAVYLARLAPGSRPTMARALDTIAGVLTAGACDRWSLPWNRVRYPHAQAVRAALGELMAWRSVNKHLSALRQVVTEAWRLGLLDAEARARVVDVPNVAGDGLLAGRGLTRGEVLALFDSCAGDRNPALGLRDAAVLGLLYGAGLRRGELAALDVAHFDAGAGALVVHGKRNKAREVPVVGGAAAAVADWCELRAAEGDKPLFVAVGKGGRLRDTRLSTTAVATAMAARARKAGVRPFTPHDCRRSFVSELFAAGADVATIQRLVGHANVATTVRYDRQPEAAKRAAAELLVVPYRRPC